MGDINGSGGEEDAFATAFPPVDVVGFLAFEEEGKFGAKFGAATGDAEDFFGFFLEGGDFGFEGFDGAGEFFVGFAVLIEEVFAFFRLERVAAFFGGELLEEAAGRFLDAGGAAEDGGFGGAGETEGLLGVAGKLFEAVVGDGAAEVVAGGVFDFMGFVEDNGLIVGEDGGEIVLADGEIGEEEMVIDDDDVCFVGALVHFGEEAGIELGAFLAGAGIAAGVEAGPEVGIVGEEVKFGAVAGFGEVHPVFDLGKPFDFVEGFEAREGRLGGEEIDFVAAEKIVAALHESDVEFGGEMFFEEGDVFVEELLLEGFGGGGNDDALAGADGGDEIAEGFAGASAGFDDGVAAFGEGVFDDFGHFDLGAAVFVAGVGFGEGAAGAEDGGDGGAVFGGGGIVGFQGA